MRPLRISFRIAGGIALLFALSVGSRIPASSAEDIRKLLKDHAAAVRLRAAKALAEAKDAAAIPVLIDLLAELPAAERASVEDLLKQWAGEWAPILQFARDDDISRRVRHDAWASWWRQCDGPMLLAALGKHMLTPDKIRKLRELLAQLGSDKFKLREDASQQLLAFGHLALPYLRETIKHGNAEAARRAKMLMEEIETGPDSRLPVAVLRLLAVRKPAGSAEALLAYLPFAEDEIRQDEVRQALIVLVRHEGERGASAPCFAALRRSLTDAQAKVRTVAAEALIEGGGDEGRAAVRKLLREDLPSIRMQLALAMVRAGEREGVSALIELFPLLSEEECGQAEEALYQLAGDTAPEMTTGAESGGKMKSRDAWAAWWKINVRRVDLSRLAAKAWLGYTLICDTNGRRVFEVDRHGKEIWSIGGLNPMDAVVLPGHRVLIAEYGADRITERDFKGKILWQMTIPRPLNVQRLPNGHTLITSDNGANRNWRVVEVDRTGKEIHSIGNFPAGIRAAYRSPLGDIVCTTADGQCRIFDRAGKQLKAFAFGNVHNNYSLDLRSDGHILITRYQENQVLEFDREGRLLLQFNTPGAVMASHLPNGHILVACGNSSRVYEMDRRGKIVWEYKGSGNFIRPRRR